MSKRDAAKLRSEGRCVTCSSSQFPIVVGSSVCSRCSEKVKRWKADPANREKQRQWGKQWRDKNRELSRELNTKYNRETKQRIMAMYGGHCVCCGETSLEFLTLDHINDDGDADRKSAKVGRGGYRHYKKMLQEPRRADLQILCMNCHHAKTHSGGCPHEKSVLRANGVTDIRWRPA